MAPVEEVDLGPPSVRETDRSAPVEVRVVLQAVDGGEGGPVHRIDLTDDRGGTTGDHRREAPRVDQLVGRRRAAPA